MVDPKLLFASIAYTSWTVMCDNYVSPTITTAPVVDETPVWRLENYAGRGVYISGIASRAGMPSYNVDRKVHPGPYEDKGLQEHFGALNADKTTKKSVHLYHFGFASRQQIDDWVYKDEWRAALVEQSTQLVEYAVPTKAVLKGTYQVAFLMSLARRVDSRAYFF